MSQRDQILNSVRDVADGLAMRDILSLHPEIPRRTAQRWMRQLVEDGELEAIGAGPSRRYRAPGQADGADGPDAPDLAIPLSSNGRELLDYASRPIPNRAPVGYQRDFLDRYEPGTTYYLPEAVRRRLRRIGSTGAEELPAGTYGREILDRLLIDLSWASSHLEGNTYSLLDTQNLLRSGQSAEGKAAFETQMILNHKAAIELLVENAATIGFDRFTILNLHSALSENLLPNLNDEGRIRQHAVGIGGSVYTPLSLPSMLDELLDLVLARAQAIDDPFEQAFFAMVHIPYLQPFADVNKRTSRLAANIPLIRDNLIPLTFIDVPPATYTAAVLAVYELARIELLRDVFVWAYERSTQKYAAVTQQLAQPDPLRLAYRDAIKAAVRNVVRQPHEPADAIIEEALRNVDEHDRASVTSVVQDELARLHEGVLARYGLRPSEFHAWHAPHSGHT